MDYKDYKSAISDLDIRSLEGSIVQFGHPYTGELYDGSVWRVIQEDPNNYSVVIRYVKKV